MRYKNFVYVPLIKEPHLPPYPLNDPNLTPAENKYRRLSWERLQNNNPFQPHAWMLTYWREANDVYIECGAWGLIRTHAMHMTNRLMGPRAWGKGRLGQKMDDTEMLCWGLK